MRARRPYVLIIEDNARMRQDLSVAFAAERFRGGAHDDFSKAFASGELQARIRVRASARPARR